MIGGASVTPVLSLDDEWHIGWFFPDEKRKKIKE
jgi:hypothetical protein